MITSAPPAETHGLVETSTVVVHADEVAGRCFVDVFSCRPFSADLAVAVAIEHFGGLATVTTLDR